MSTLIYLAVPVFLLTVVLEYRLSRGRPVKGYERRDTRASLSLGVINVVVAAAVKGGALALYAACNQIALFHIEPAWWSWLLVIIGDDFCYYWFHRCHHEVRLLWAAHVNHHSSQRFNLSTALRQSWATPVTGPVFWAPLALLGFPALMILTAQAVSLLYQYWIHTELIDRMGRFEYLMNTPSHHRVHHGRNVQYLDRNYAGIFMIWDRLFGSFEPEDEAVDYGLTKNLESTRLWTVAMHEWQAMARDVAAAKGWRERLGRIFLRPGWSPDGSTLTAPELRARRAAGPAVGG